ncbi:hypothetical protein ACFW7J_07885 [Streptomyces sp. NPDC059525]|uniref:hypothetical protein n=1 Tax=Streptomyces sp. NPDC059525 TaxID=3346857 RepID=UPI0036CE881B
MEPIGAGIEPDDSAFDEVECPGHGAEVDPFVGGAAVDVGDVAEQRFLAVPPPCCRAGTQPCTRLLSVEPWQVRRR